MHPWRVRGTPEDSPPPICQKSFPVLSRALAPSTCITGPCLSSGATDQAPSAAPGQISTQGISHESSDLSSKASSCGSSTCFSRTAWDAVNFAFLAILSHCWLVHTGASSKSPWEAGFEGPILPSCSLSGNLHPKCKTPYLAWQASIRCLQACGPRQSRPLGMLTCHSTQDYPGSSRTLQAGSPQNHHLSINTLQVVIAAPKNVPSLFLYLVNQRLNAILRSDNPLLPFYNNLLKRGIESELPSPTGMPVTVSHAPVFPFILSLSPPMARVHVHHELIDENTLVPGDERSVLLHSLNA